MVTALCVPALLLFVLLVAFFVYGLRIELQRKEPEARDIAIGGICISFVFFFLQALVVVGVNR